MNTTLAQKTYNNIIIYFTLPKPRQFSVNHSSALPQLNSSSTNRKFMKNLLKHSFPLHWQTFSRQKCFNNARTTLTKDPSQERLKGDLVEQPELKKKNVYTTICWLPC